MPGLSECCGQVRNSMQLLQALGLRGHPAVAEAMAASRRYRVTHNVVSDILCHTDAHTTYAKHDHKFLPRTFVEVVDSDDEVSHAVYDGGEVPEEPHLQVHRGGHLHSLLLRHAPEFLKVRNKCSPVGEGIRAFEGLESESYVCCWFLG